MLKLTLRAPSEASEYNEHSSSVSDVVNSVSSLLDDFWNAFVLLTGL
jgi:hypothetical protein